MLSFIKDLELVLYLDISWCWFLRLRCPEFRCWILGCGEERLHVQQPDLHWGVWTLHSGRHSYTCCFYTLIWCMSKTIGNQMQKKKSSYNSKARAALTCITVPICCIVYGELLEKKSEISKRNKWRGHTCMWTRLIFGCNVGTCPFSWYLICSFGTGRRLRGRTLNTSDVPAQPVPVLADCHLRSMEEQSSSVTMETGTCWPISTVVVSINIILF